MVGFRPTVLVSDLNADDKHRWQSNCRHECKVSERVDQSSTAQWAKILVWSELMTDRKSRAAWMLGKNWRKNKLAHSFALLSVIGLVATGTFAVEDSAKISGGGLNGVFPTAVPSDLSPDEFAKLDGNWAEWSKGAAAAVADFYSGIEKADATTQRQSLGKLKIKLDVMRRALDDPRYRTLHAPLANLHNSLSLRVDLAEAALDTLETDSKGVSANRVKTRSAELLNSIGVLEKFVSRRANGNLWLPYFKADSLKSALQADPQGQAAIAAANQAAKVLQNRGYILDNVQKEYTTQPAFEAYASSVGLYLQAANWAPAADDKAVRLELKGLASSLDAYTATGENAKDLRLAIARARMAAPDGGDRLTSSLEQRFFNYNLRILATEPFLNKIMGQQRTETGQVVDCILGANVNGCQITNTAVGVDLKPSNTSARFDLRLTGHIQSNTTGTTPEATVWTFGNHTFTALKEVNFDGKNFSTGPATIAVSPHNTTTGITTKFSRIPILGGIANRIAANEVEAKRGEAESIAASRVQDGVLPRFNSEVNANFSKAGDRLEKELYSGLRSTRLYPDTYVYQTTDRLLTMSARLMPEDQLAANVPDAGLMTVNGSGAKALLHETIINNAIDQMGIAGQTLTEPELRAKVESFLTAALSRPFKFSAPEPKAEGEDADEKSLKAIIFAPTSPIRIRITNDEMAIVIRAGFKQEGKEDVPMREITVPVAFEVQGKNIAVKRGNVVVAAVEGGGGFSTNAVVRKKIQSVMPDRVVDGKVEFKTDNKTVVAYVTNLTLSPGWVAVAID